MRLSTFLISGLALAFAIVVEAAGPSVIAKSTTDYWPYSITSKEKFDAASRAEILIFLSVYRDMFSKGVEASDLGVKSIQVDSFDRWQTRFKTNWLNTFLDATKSCKNSQEWGCDFKESNFDKLLAYSEKSIATLPSEYNAWIKMSKDFYRAYLTEQARLAALFPKPTSEILPLNDSEILGDHFKEGEFLITLDDGPTQTDDTKKYSQLLKANGISAFFFALGDVLETKLNKTTPATLKEMYQGHCLASHGYHHQSHQKWTDWKSSLDKTSDLIKKITHQTSVHFRPPYGQVQESLIQYLNNQPTKIFLWNIDSQDWQKTMTPDEVSVRVKKLMLLWRKGIILFHDVHKKGLTAIPQIIELGKAGKIHWVDCSTL